MSPHLSDRWRLTVVACGVFFLFALLVVQFYWVQIIEHTKWLRYAHAQHEGFVSEPFRRGTFYSNVTVKKGHPQTPQPLVLDIPKFHLHIDPASIRDDVKAEMIDSLSLVLPVDREKLIEEFSRSNRNRQIARWLDPDQQDAIQKWWRPFAKQHKLPSNALFFTRDYQRSYPFGKLLGQVLHTIRDYKDEKTQQGLPTGGLEAFFNDYLKGSPGKRWVLRSPRHRLAAGTIVEPAVDGADITLTINHHLQAIAEEEIELGVRKVEAKGGWAVVIKPQTGEILALAQYPSFYPEHYRNYFNDPEKAADTLVKGVTYAFEPGSVFKPLIVAICLAANDELTARGEPPIFTPEEKITLGNGIFPGRSKPVKDVFRSHYLNLDMAVQKSSNVYLAHLISRVSERLGNEWIHQQLLALNLGEKTGIELQGETPGFLPTPGASYGSGRPQWSQGTNYALVMGYNLLTNTIQLAQTWTPLANHGRLVHPTLVKRIARGDEILFDLDDHLKAHPPRQVFEPHVIERTVEAMRYTTQRGGTAALGEVPGYTEVGKTGTTEKLIGGTYAKNVHITTFVGFTPATQPELLIVVQVDEPPKRYIPGYGFTHFGGKSTAPIFREIARRSLDYLGVRPDDPYGHPVGDPRRDPDKASWVKENTQLREKFEEWNH